MDNTAGAQNFAIARCPSGIKLLSGGALSTRDTSDIELLSGWPMDDHRYKAVMWNGSGRDEKLTSFAVCAQKPPRYTITTSSFTDVGGRSRTSAAPSVQRARRSWAAAST